MPNFSSPADVITALRHIYDRLPLLHPLTYSNARLARLAGWRIKRLTAWSTGRLPCGPAIRAKGSPFLLTHGCGKGGSKLFTC